MSDSEFEAYDSGHPAPIVEQKTKSRRKPSADSNGKRKSYPPSKHLAHTSKKTNTGSDIFGISNSRGTVTELNESSTSTPVLSSFFVNRVANGCERRAAKTDGEYYIDCKVYKANDALLTDSLELWKKALVRVKFQTDADSLQWRKLQDLIRSVDTLFTEQPIFTDK